MPATLSRPSTRELLGGRWAISLRGWVIGSVLVSITPVLSLRALPSMTPGALLQIILAQWFVISVITLAGHLTIFRHRRTATVAIGWVIAFAIVMGLGRVATLYVVQLVSPFTTLPMLELMGIAIAVMPVTSVTFVLIIYLLAIKDWYGTERERLMQFEVDVEAARLRALGALDATRAVLTTRIREDLENQLAGLNTTSSSEHLQLSDTVLDAAAKYLRPESHALWPQREAPSRRSSFRELERASLTEPLPLLLPFALWAVSAVPFVFVRTNLARTSITFVAVLIGMVIAYPLGRRAIRRFAPAPHFTRARLIALATMIAAGVPIVAHNRINARFDTTSGLLLALVVTPMIVAFTVAVSWALAGQRVQSERLRALRSQAEEAEFQRLALEAATEQMQRDLALYLHGTVQAGLVASAYAMQDAASRGDEVALEHAIADARAATARVSDEAPTLAGPDLASVRAEIDETWQGMLTIRWSLPDVELAVPVVDRLGNVIQECLANASIHGAATEATVRVVVESDCVIVEITDNGSGLGDGKPGLGSAVLNEATHSRWSIASVPTGGAQVRAVVPN